MSEIKWHNRARKQMKLIPAEYREAIHERVDMLVDFPAIVGIIGCGLAVIGYCLTMIPA